METDVSFLSQSLDLSMDGSFSDFTSQAGLLDPRSHPPFDQALAGKPSPGTPSQFLLTPSSLWDRPAFDDAAMDIFADFSEAHDEVSEKVQSTQALEQAPIKISTQVTAPVPEHSKIKEESPAPPASSQVTRRLTRATSSGSQVTRNTPGRDKLLAVSSSEATKVKKPRTTSKRPNKRTRGQAKDKQAPKEEEIVYDFGQSESFQTGDQPVGEDYVRRNKFLERNRVAASKCRQKKKEWMHSLEETKAELEKTHTTLHETLNGLLAEISVMKEHLMMHANCGDQNIDRWFANEARKFVESKTREDDARRPSLSSGSGETQQSGRSSVVQFSPTSSIVPTTSPSPKVKEEAFSYDYMPDDMFADDNV